MSQYLTFQLDGRYYGVNVEHINSVLDPQEITPLPHVSTIVTGLTNVRGIVVPVFEPAAVLAGMRIDEGRLDSIAETAIASETSAYDAAADAGLIIFEIPNGTMLQFIGIQVDRIGKVILLDSGKMAPVPSFLPDSAAAFLEGFCYVGENRHAILNLSALVARELLFAESGGVHG
ncbi:MAG: chemotaxis protein CheW [Spirochaetes bacterium]|nr:chemotaxis protein CheW [Spirochaetota bacterium]MBU0956629.1 chemotaxis protein CheW [Spirochaetota bacterium]